jgi:DNA repair exonuclease SbcCD ATPase subunit
VIQIEDIKKKRTQIDRELGRLKGKQEELAVIREELAAASKTLSDARIARVVMQNVAESVQKKIEYRISTIVTMVLAAVFPDPYSFQLRFVQRHNRTEADLIFIKNGNETDDLLNAGGGGPADVASLTLRLAFGGIKPSHAVQLLDEPTRNVSRDLQPKVSRIIKELSDKLGIQFIVVTHVEELKEMADNIISISNVDGESIVERE